MLVITHALKLTNSREKKKYALVTFNSICTFMFFAVDIITLFVKVASYVMKIIVNERKGCYNSSYKTYKFGT